MAISNVQPKADLPCDPDNVGDDLFRLMAESVRDYAIFLLDPLGNIRTWNKGAMRIKGYEADDVLGRHFSMFYPPEALARHLPEEELLGARTDGRFEDEGWRLRKDGSRFWANVVITALVDRDGRFRGYSKITRDLTVRREHEELLRRSEERFRLLVEGVRDYAIFMLDPDGHIVSWNTGAEQTKGYRAAEIIGQHFSVFYPEDVAATGWPQRELEYALRDGRFEDEGWRVRKDGSRFWANVVITALHDDRGQHIGFAKVTRDLSEKHRMRMLEDEGRRLTTFIAMLGHELRNPLAPIMNAVSIMQMEPLGSERVRACRDVIERQAQQLTRLMDDLLDVGRITSGKIHVEQLPLEIGEVLRHAMEATDPLVQAQSHHATLELPQHDVWVVGDRARLLQVVSNLLNNAAKFTPPGGEISASLQVDGDCAEIRIRDTGPGIPSEQLEDIFGMFVQGEQDHARPHGGLGLGLSLVHQLVALHGGNVRAFSSGEPGKGAEFVVRLPAIAAPTGSAPDAARWNS